MLGKQMKAGAGVKKGKNNKQAANAKKQNAKKKNKPKKEGAGKDGAEKNDDLSESMRKKLAIAKAYEGYEDDDDDYKKKRRESEG